MIGLGLSITQLAVRQLLGGSFNPLDLFANSEPGVWYDPSDMSTLFQDAAGATPVIAVEQPVGLMLDKSKGLVLGPELVTNGDFSDGTTGWTSVNGTISVVDGALRVAQGATADFTRAIGVVTCVVGVTYKIIGTLVGKTAANASIRVSTTTTGTGIGVFNQNISDASGVFSGYFLATDTTMYVWALVNSTANDVYADFDNISVRELPGNHATQATATARSIYRAAPQRLVYDGIDDSHNTTFAASLGTNCTIARAVPGVGTSILTGQTVGTTFTNTTTHAGLLVINRALTAGETAKLTDYFNAKAVV